MTRLVEQISMFTNLFGEPSQADAPDYGILEMLIPGFSSGCLPLNSLLLSTLECFFDQACLDQLLTFFPTTETFTALIQAEDSRFQRSAPSIQTLVDHLMVETWSTNASFDQYFSQCAPVVCTYSTNVRGDVSSIVSKLIRASGWVDSDSRSHHSAHCSLHSNTSWSSSTTCST